MKRIYLLGVLALYTYAANAQSNLQYTDEGFNTRKVEQIYATQSPGQQFYNRMNALYTVSANNADTRVTLSNYNAYLKKFEKIYAMGSGEGTIAHNLNAMALTLNTINDLAYANDEYRNTLYHLTYPVYTAVMQDWGDEIITVAIANAYFDMREYVSAKAVDDMTMREGLNTMDRMPLKTAESTGSCSYSIELKPSLGKDKIEIYITDPALYYKAVKKFPTDNLLVGPVVGWENHTDESNSVRNILKTYAAAPEYKGYNVYSSDVTPEKGYKIEQKLNKGTKWFMMVFRNDKLYFSYMIEPCGYLSKSTIQ
jgi:hypothetical protein